MDYARLNHGSDIEDEQSPVLASRHKSAVGGGGSRVVQPSFSARFSCHRSGLRAQASTRSSKKIGCDFLLLFTLVIFNNKAYYEIREAHPHTNHVPGDIEDLKWLPPDEEICRRIDEVRIKLGVVLLIDFTGSSAHMMYHLNAALVPGH